MRPMFVQLSSNPTALLLVLAALVQGDLHCRRALPAEACERLRCAAYVTDMVAEDPVALEQAGMGSPYDLVRAKAASEPPGTAIGLVAWRGELRPFLRRPDGSVYDPQGQVPSYDGATTIVLSQAQAPAAPAAAPTVKQGPTVKQPLMVRGGATVAGQTPASLPPPTRAPAAPTAGGRPSVMVRGGPQRRVTVGASGRSALATVTDLPPLLPGALSALSGRGRLRGGPTLFERNFTRVVPGCGGSCGV